MSLEKSLLTGICHDHIVSAAQMVRIGNLTLARGELTSALETINQLEALSVAPERQFVAALEAETISTIHSILPIAS